MPSGEADGVQVIVFSPRPDAFRRAGGTPVVPLLATGEDVLELDHPGVGKEQGWVVLRDQRRRGNPTMHALLKAGQEFFTDLCRRRHGSSLIALIPESLI